MIMMKPNVVVVGMGLEALPSGAMARVLARLSPEQRAWVRSTSRGMRAQVLDAFMQPTAEAPVSCTLEMAEEEEEDEVAKRAQNIQQLLGQIVPAARAYASLRLHVRVGRRSPLSALACLPGWLERLHNNNDKDKKEGALMMMITDLLIDLWITRTDEAALMRLQQQQKKIAVCERLGLRRIRVAFVVLDGGQEEDYYCYNDTTDSGCDVSARSAWRAAMETIRRLAMTTTTTRAAIELTTLPNAHARIAAFPSGFPMGAWLQNLTAVCLGPYERQGVSVCWSTVQELLCQSRGLRSVEIYCDSVPMSLISLRMAECLAGSLETLERLVIRFAPVQDMDLSAMLADALAVANRAPCLMHVEIGQSVFHASLSEMQLLNAIAEFPTRVVRLRCFYIERLGS